MRKEKSNNTKKNEFEKGEVADDHQGDGPTLKGFKEIKLVADYKHKFEPLADKKGLTPDERKLIIEQALTLIDDVYVHLPLKQAMHAVDPIQRLKLLKYRNYKLDDRAFHNRMISIFTELRDLHTNYTLPDPYRKKAAFLPFLIEEFYDGEGEPRKRKYMVSKVFKGDMKKSKESFKEGVIITHWNGMPIDRAVELNGERNAGCNEYARHARGLERMTIRPLMMSLPPDEAWVDINFQDNNENHQVRFSWYVTPPSMPVGSGVDSKERAIRTALGVDIETEIARRVKKSLFLPKDRDYEEKMQEYHPTMGGDVDSAPDIDKISVMPDVFTFRKGKTSFGTYGYIRIYTFNVKNADHFVAEFVRIARLLPQDGLIIDIRGNGGGLITAGEKLLQVLTPKRIEPERFHFINTPLMLQLCQRYNWLEKWAPSIARSIETGAIYSQGFHLEDVEEYNRIGQKYYGPVVLITNALCYSTTDIFAAGFKDHKIGTILGVDGNTGAGGANVWTHDLLKDLFPNDSSIQELPQNAAFRVAIRRTTRVGDMVGMPLEDLGVRPDCIHQMTKDDLLHRNKDLIEKAGSILAGRVKCENGEKV